MFAALGRDSAHLVLGRFIVDARDFERAVAGDRTHVRLAIVADLGQFAVPESGEPQIRWEAGLLPY